MHDYQSNLDSSLPLDLGPDGSGPLYERLARALREAIRCSRLPAGSLLPPSRILAADLGCSRWVVTEAYAQLATAGFVEARTGSGTRVRVPGTTPARPRDQPPASARATGRIDMAPGLPDLRAFPAARWAAAVRSAAATLPIADLGYPDPAGHQALREVLAEYLTRARGAQADPGHLTICASATDGIGRICRALRRAGCQAVAVEDPGWHRAREVAGAAGLAIRPNPVDDHGMRADLPGDVGAVIVTPAHQFPAGVVLSARRRAALLDWARRTGGLIIEDDYDAEYRYDRRPVTAVQGAGPSHVALLGSVSKILSPALRIGWVVSPPAWTPALREPPAAAPPVLDQLAFAAFLRSGSYDRHLRAGRKRYRARRDNLVAALTASIPEATVSGAAAGLHLLLGLGTEADSGAVRSHALKLGVRVANLDKYRCSGQPWQGLVLGYGNLADHQVDEGVALLATAIHRLPRPRRAQMPPRHDDNMHLTETRCQRPLAAQPPSPGLPSLGIDWSPNAVRRADRSPRNPAVRRNGHHPSSTGTPHLTVLECRFGIVMCAYGRDAKLFVWLLAVASVGCAGGLRPWVVPSGSFGGPGVTLGPGSGGGLA